MENLLVHFHSSNATNIQTIALPTFSGWVEIPTSEIIRLEGQSNYTVFILADGQRLIYAKTISLFEKRLSCPFIRIHKSHIINLNYLHENGQRGKNELIMTDGHSVRISRRRRSEVYQWLQAYRQMI